MSNDLSHLMEALGTGDEKGALERLEALVVRYKREESEVEELEEKLKRAKERFNRTKQQDIPEVLLQNGLSEIRLKSGEKLRVTQKVSASIKDVEKFAAFLEARNDDDILKTVFELGKVPAEVLSIMKRTLAEQFEVYPKVKQTVHPQTLAKYIRELCGVGVEKREDEEFLALQDLPESVSVFVYYDTAIKNK